MYVCPGYEEIRVEWRIARNQYNVMSMPRQFAQGPNLELFIRRVIPSIIEKKIADIYDFLGHKTGVEGRKSLHFD